jgi:hypothetical protein
MYEILSFDVWGNAAEGFEVNNQFRRGEIYLRPHETALDVVRQLIEHGALLPGAEAALLGGTLTVDLDEMITVSDVETELAVVTGGDGNRWLDVHGTLAQVRARAIEDELLEGDETPEDIEEVSDDRPILTLWPMWEHDELGPSFYETEIPAQLNVCQFCGQERGGNDECGGEGEGICEGYAMVIDPDHHTVPALGVVAHLSSEPLMISFVVLGTGARAQIYDDLFRFHLEEWDGFEIGYHPFTREPLSLTKTQSEGLKVAMDQFMEQT